MAEFVTFRDGTRGEIWPELIATSAPVRVRVRLQNEQQVFVPSELLVPTDENNYTVALGVNELVDLEAKFPAHQAETIDSDIDNNETLTIPLSAEIARFDKQPVVRSRVLITKTVHEHQEVIDEPLRRIGAEITRRPVGQIVDVMPEIRREGNTTVVPVVEEVIVVEKRLMLVEEVLIAEVETTFHNPQSITLKREEVTIDRLP